MSTWNKEENLFKNSEGKWGKATAAALHLPWCVTGLIAMYMYSKVDLKRVKTVILKILLMLLKL